MSTISFSGLGSGMDYSSWVDALVEVKESQTVTPVETKISSVEKSQSAISTIKSAFSTLSSTISTFTDSNVLSAYDIFSRKKVSTSDYEKTATATVTNAASVQNFELRVEQLATPTKATGMNNLGALANLDTKLKNLNNGVVETTRDEDNIADVAIYVNNKKYTFEVTDESTLQDFIDFLGEKTGGTVNYTDGILSVDLPADVTDVKLGSTADGGNLLDFLGFKTERDEDGNLTGFTSNKTLTKIDTTKAITGAGNMAQTVTEGTFTIGTVEFIIESDTSISGLINQINSNSDTGVTAAYDAITNKLILTAKEAGSTTINIEAGTSNFTDVVGWTTSANGVNELAEGSQELGKNALFKINDEEFEAASNTIGEDVTGITGLTLTLKKVTTNDETQTITIDNDLTEVEETIDKFVSQYNSLVSGLKEVSGANGYLAYDSSIRKMITEMANLLMDAVPGLNNYNCFSNVGIGTGGASANISDTSNTLTFDKTKFEEAMATNQAEVKKLFVNNPESYDKYRIMLQDGEGNWSISESFKDETEANARLEEIRQQIAGGTSSATDVKMLKPGEESENTKNGVMVKFDHLIDTYLEDESGYISIKEKSYEDQVKSLNQKLTQKQNALTSYKERLTKQFQNMDTYISKMQSYSSYISSISSSS